ncbi:MAG TPA: hypothetical protein VG759_21955 [Candidatus Angelobacter sp.]|jgi:Asp-tRNA(Asn)/Glu-tRNA(Gln) amidotransferase C subunit|nr:hypothetical protein [Candidatus Angelobacter sp.]
MICNGLLQRIFRPFILVVAILSVFLLCTLRVFAQAPSQERKMAIHAQELLEDVDGLAKVAAPGMRSFLLLELANSYQAIDISKVPEYLTQAFESSTAITDDVNTKQRLQAQIVSRLLHFGTSEVEGLLPVATGTGRMFVLKALAAKCVADRRYEDALALLDEITSETEFPYATATQVMLSLPAARNAEKQRLFVKALQNYKATEHKQLAIGSDDLATMVVRFHRMIPRSLLLEAIDEILTQARQTTPGRFDLSSNLGAASFSSNYEYRLFEVLPVLTELDPDRAKSLLEEQQNVKGMLRQFPDGIQSLDKTIRDSPLTKGEASLLTTTVSVGGKADATNLLGERLRQSVDSAVAAAAENPAQAIANAVRLPVRVGNRNPRADALEAIASAAFISSPTLAKQALRELKTTALEKVPAFDKADYLSRIADLEIKAKETDSAVETIHSGLQVADELLSADESTDDPNQAVKAYWPSTHVWRIFIELADKISHRFAQESLDKLRDPEIALLSRITLADSWLEVKPVMSDVIEKHHSGEKYKGASNSPTR